MNWREILNKGYPQNILYVLGIENPNEDQVQGLYYALNSIEVKAKYRSYLRYRFFETMTLQEIGELFEVPKQSVDSSIKLYLQKIKDSEYFPYIYFGYNKYSNILKLEEEQKEQEQLEKDIRKLSEQLNIPLNITVAKGMTNFVCLNRLKNVLSRKHNDIYDEIDLEKQDRKYYPDFKDDKWEKICVDNCTYTRCKNYGNRPYGAHVHYSRKHGQVCDVARGYVYFLLFHARRSREYFVFESIRKSGGIRYEKEF